MKDIKFETIALSAVYSSISLCTKLEIGYYSRILKKDLIFGVDKEIERMKVDKLNLRNINIDKRF